MKNNKKTTRFVLPASLLAGGMMVGAIFSPIALSGAQTGDDGSDTSADSSATAEAPEAGHRKGGHHRPGITEEVLEELGLSVDDLKAGHEAGLTLVEIAAQNGITEADLIAAIETSTTEHLAQAVADGTIDADRAAEIEAELTDRITERVNTVRERGAGGEGRGQRRQAMMESLTELGLDADAVRAGRDEGKTLAEVAAEAGISEADLVDALVAGAEERLETAVSDGRIDEDRATELEAELESRITDRVNGERGARGHHGGRFGRQADAAEETGA